MSERNLELVELETAIRLRNMCTSDFPHRVVPNLCDGVDRLQSSSNPSNRLKTTKYNVFTFLPIQVFMQLTKVINLFYVLNCVL